MSSIQNSLETLEDNTLAWKSLFAIIFCASSETEEKKKHAGIIHAYTLITMSIFYS